MSHNPPIATHTVDSSIASITLPDDGQSGTSIALQGRWTAQGLGKIETELQRIMNTLHSPATLDLTGISQLDTAGALLINKMINTYSHLTIATICTNPRHKDLLHISALSDDALLHEKPLPVLVRFLSNTGEAVCKNLWEWAQLIGFIGHFFVALLWLLPRPSRVRWTSLTFHIEQTGLRAVPIVALLTLLIGMVVAYMGSEELARFGAQVFAVNLLQVTILREMGVLITAIVVAGRSSSSFTAQIGAMVANEEVDAIRSMGLNPMILLVIPRVLALMITLPLLVFLANIMAMFGGALALWYSMDLNIPNFLSQLQQVAKLSNFFVGMIKTPFFAIAIGLVGCFQGFQATTSAESVGFLTTKAVVQSIFITILLDALFAIFFTTLKI